MNQALTRISLTMLVLTCALLGGCTYMSEMRYRPQLKAANQAFADQEYALAATRYESLSDRYPSTQRRQEMTLRQGISLYTVAAYHDARDVFLRYLAEYPRGLFVQDAQVYLAKIDVLMSSDNLADKAAIEAAKADLNQLQQMKLQHPHDPNIPYAIGNLYYGMGNYDEAVRYYYEATSIDAAYKEKLLVQQRMMVDDKGQLHPVTPADQKRADRERNPLVVFNTNSYTERDHESILSHNEKRFFQVTGLVRNQSSRLLTNVVVEVRFLNAIGQILDVQSVTLGAMGPDEVRAFRAAADNYDDLYNITTFVTLPQWGR